MRGRNDRGDDGMGLGSKLTLGLALWKMTKGLAKLGALIGAAFLGWRVVRGALERRSSSSAEAPAIA